MSREKKGAKKVTITRRGYDMSYTFPSIVSAAKEIGRSKEYVRARIADGYACFTNQGIALRIKFAEQ